ncbi:MAG: hypothetical protein M3Y07_14040 [Acidobacteriota bacterium]|nr:hypothetical protein [Acidobacteriota bacterium]
MRRLLRELTRRGDQAVVHALRGLPSNRKIGEELRSRAVEILSREVYRGFGPTLAMEHLNRKHGIKVGKETVRQWMVGRNWPGIGHFYFALTRLASTLIYATL